MRVNVNAIWCQSQGTLKAEIALVNDLYRWSVYESAHGMKQLLCQESAATLAAAKQAVFAAFDSIDTDSEDKQAAMLEEMLEDAKDDVGTGDA